MCHTCPLHVRVSLVQKPGCEELVGRILPPETSLGSTQNSYSAPAAYLREAGLIQQSPCLWGTGYSGDNAVPLMACRL